MLPEFEFEVWKVTLMTKLQQLKYIKYLPVLFALVIIPSMAKAQAIWVDYGLVMKPGSQNTAVAAVDAYFGDNENFEGIAIFNDSMINGPSPQTHNLALVYKDHASYEKSRQAMLNTPERQKFLQTMFANGNVLTETVYAHVAGWGKTAQEGTQYIGFAMQVSNPQRYAAMLEEYSKVPGNATEIAGIDLFQVVAGGSPGVSHVAVIAVGNRADFMARYTDPAFGKYLRKFGQVRKVLGASYSNNLSFNGPLDLESIR